MVEVEGLHSPKAIAFISNRLKPNNYFTVGNPSETNRILETRKNASEQTESSVKQGLGDMIWIK